MQLVCLQIDLARQKETLDYVKSYIDFAAENGYNSLIMYLENLVRTPSTEYFDLEESYSQDEIKELVAYAESRGLDVIPAFENLGHLERFFRYPQWQGFAEINKDTQGRFVSDKPFGTCGCSSNLDMYVALDKYILEVCSLFHSPYVHMGLDEPFDFAICARCAEKMNKENLTKADLFYEHIMHSYELVKSMGRTMMMWDDFFQYADVVERLPRDIIFCTWNYYHISDEPGGHWTNRIKRDWFYYYDKLGFRYVFCVYGHRASNLYNLETLTAYAEKYHPLGGMVTQWERSETFYEGSYPFVAFAGRRWSGQVRDEDAVSVYAEVLGNKDAAELILSLEIPQFYWGYYDVATYCEGDYLMKMQWEKQLGYASSKLRVYKDGATGKQKDFLSDIFAHVYEKYLNVRLERLGVQIFNSYESDSVSKEYLLAELDKLSAGYTEIENCAKVLWAKYRQGIKSFKVGVEGKFNGLRARIEKIKADIQKNTDVGVFYTDLMLHDGFGTVRGAIRVKYVGDEVETVIHDGGIKSTLAGFETGGCYNFRYVMQNRALEYAIFTVYGEGALYPLHFRYTSKGVKYVAATVERLCGKVLNADMVLCNDTRFALMGNDDGLAHFNDLSLAKEKHEIKITFKPLGE